MAGTSSEPTPGMASELKSSLIYLGLIAALIFIPAAIPGVSFLYIVGFYLGVMIVTYLTICAIGLVRALRRGD